MVGSRSTVTRTGLARIAVRPGSRAGFLRAVTAPPVRPARPSCPLTWAKTKLKPRLALQVVKRTEQRKFIVLPRRWVVERTFSWITRSWRTIRDYERLPGHHETMVYWAMTIIMTRRLARHNQSHQLHPT